MPNFIALLVIQIVNVAAIAGQRADYHEKVLHAYRTGERKISAMSAMSGSLTEADVEALAAYYARQKPRSVIYVPMPSKCTRFSQFNRELEACLLNH